MPPFLKRLFFLLVLLNLVRIASTGLGNLQVDDPHAALWASIAATARLLLLLVVIGCFTKRLRDSRLALRMTLLIIVVMQLAFSLPGLHTPFDEAWSSLKLLQIIDWLEVFVCVALFVALRFQTVKSWFAAY